MISPKTLIQTKSKKNMKRICFLTAGTALLFALTTVAQETTQPGDDKKSASVRVQDSEGGHGGPTVQRHLKLLTEKLQLSGEQQAKAKPILEEMQAATDKFTQDENMSHEELLSQVRVVREKADKDLRKILNDDQKKKLDELEHQPHPELHGDLNGTAPKTH